MCVSLRKSKSGSCFYLNAANSLLKQKRSTSCKIKKKTFEVLMALVCNVPKVVYCIQRIVSNMSKTRVSASSRVPNTEKQMKARGRRPSAFICFEVFGTCDEARSPSF